MKIFPPVLVIVALAVFSSLAPAQKLPVGAYRANRERSYDIIHYKAEIDLDVGRHRVAGTATITLTPLRPIDSVSLDAFHVNVKSVSDGGAKNLGYQSTSRSLNIALLHRPAPGDTLTLVVVYNCMPRAGMYFKRDRDNPKLMYVTTYGEGGLHANWLPIYNDVNDKFSTEMLVTVPPPYVVISNGKLMNTISRPNGRVTFHWLQEIPHSNYLIALYVGDFEKGDLPPAFGSIPLSYWVPRGRLSDGGYAFRNTTRMLEFFSKKLGYTYPWDKYDQVAVPDYAIGAMEHTSVTGHRESVLRDESAPLDFGGPKFSEYSTDWTAEATISHELAHHWFGDNLTCRNLSTIWLNESFASYMMMLWDEESVGRDQLLFDVDLARTHYFEYVAKKHIIRPLEYHYFDNPDLIYNEQHIYLKGAAILHMLRCVLGDDEFFLALSHYLHTHEFSNVESHDLKNAIEESSGKNLDWFFDQWVHGGGHPQFEVEYRYLPDRKVIDLTVRQVQPIVEGQGLFTLPVTVTIATPSKTWNERIWVRNEEEHFVLTSGEKPLMVSFDGVGDLVGEIRFDKDIEELAYQATRDVLPGRLAAMRQLAARFPTDKRTAKLFAEIISRPAFWADAAEAALQLGQIRTPTAEEVALRALQSTDYRVRKAAAIALSRFGTQSGEETLLNVIRNDSNTDVVGAAIVGIARANHDVDPELIKAQLGRKAWYDEITIACLQAFGELKNPRFVPIIKKYTGDAFNQNVREAALRAWAEYESANKELHTLLIELARSAPLTFQKKAIEMLGELYISNGVRVLTDLIEQNGDANLTVLAKEALEKINRAAK